MGNRQYFFHREDLVEGGWDKLVDEYYNDTDKEINVEFKPDKTPRGLRARDVKRIES